MQIRDYVSRRKCRSDVVASFQRDLESIQHGSSSKCCELGSFVSDVCLFVQSLLW